MALLILKNEAPELFAGKKIIIHNPPLHDGPEFSGGRFWNRSIETIFDVSYRNWGFKSVRDHDVYIVRDPEEMSEVLDRLQADWDIRHDVAARGTGPGRQAANPKGAVPD